MNLLSFPLLLLLGAHVANASMDLYIREKYHDANGAPCTSCTQDDECYLRSRAYFVRRSCFNRGDDKSSVYDEVEEGIVCRQDFRASCKEVGLEDISFDAEEVEDCRDSWNVDECLESEQMKKFSSWCMESNEAVGEYTVPLLSFQEFETGEEICGSTDYTHLLLPDEGGACIPMSFESRNGMTIDGSRQGSCNGSVFNAVRYESTDCTGDAEKINLDGSSDECPSSPDGDYTYTNNCGAPTIYCKALPFLVGVSEEDAAEENVAEEIAADDVGGSVENADGNGGETLPASAAGHHAAMGGLLVVGVALISWIA